MKKTFSVLLAILLVLCMSVPAIAAPPPEVNVETITLKDGYATITTVIEEPLTSFSARASTRKASKVYRAYNALNKLLWSYTLTGQFTYNGSTATATRATDSYTISNSDWSNDYSSTSYSDDTAYGDASFSSSIEEQSCSLSITCGADGEIY